MFSTNLLRIKLYTTVMNGMSLLSLFTLTQRVLPQSVKFPYQQNIPVQCGGNIDRVTNAQQLLQRLNARELQQVFQNTQRSVDGNHQHFVSDRLGDLKRPEFTSPSFLVFESPKIDPSKRPSLGRRKLMGENVEHRAGRQNTPFFILVNCERRMCIVLWEFHRISSAKSWVSQRFPWLSHSCNFFSVCASVALARSSHLVVLMNELRKCIHCIPLWGFKSGAKSLQSGASSKTKN